MSILQPLTPPLGFEQLSKEEQIHYVQQLWDIIAAAPDELPVPKWHLDVIRDRRDSYDPEQTYPWSQVKEQLLSKYRDR